MRRNQQLSGVEIVLTLFLTVLSGVYISGKTVVVDTNQDKCYDNWNQISCPGPGSAFAGQDAQYSGTRQSYTDNGNGTVTDNNTGLMWQKTPGEKMTFPDAKAAATTFRLAGYSDWRLPTIKELYSLMDFSGMTGMSAESSIPYINTEYFDFNYGDTSAGERFIDAQYCSSTEYVSTTMDGSPTVFGVNFADGRIKGYGYARNGIASKTFYVMYVRGATGYGNNNFQDNGDGTVTDLSTGLMWMKVDSGHLGAGDLGDGGLDWEQALNWAENLTYAGYDDWRLPNAKELQGIVDYTRSPDTTHSPAIDPVFQTTSIRDGYGQINYPYFWTGTTHTEGDRATAAVYIAFGEAQGYMNYTLMDVHGAGAQRSDPKFGDPDDYPWGRGPQGDVIYIYNYVRCVRKVTVQTAAYRTLTVNSSPSGANISVSPSDKNGDGSGNTGFTRTYASGATVTLTAPATFSGSIFSKWLVGNTEYSSTSIKVTVSADTVATAYYSNGSGSSVNLELDKTQLTFRSVKGGQVSFQYLGIDCDGTDSFSWTAASSPSWLTVSPSGGSGSGSLTVSANVGSLGTGNYSGAISISCPLASNSPVTVPVSLTVVDGSGSKPFGSLDSPVNGAHVLGSIPVTGWVLDDIGVESVKIYCTYGGNQFLIGNAVFVGGARPDVETLYPGYPDNDRAGWGYMLLTYGLPNKGNGKYTITAIATDLEGNAVSLGISTIYSDNANAVKPFGAIDTPEQGGIASGNSYRHRGWVLTPRPNFIPTDGSTISVLINGKKVGIPVFNLYRSDIAGLFPGYTNCEGAGGYFDLDTTAYADGVHTISWSVTDSDGNTEGIGSRFFTIRNTGQRLERMECPVLDASFDKSKNIHISESFDTTDLNTEVKEKVPGNNGEIEIKIEELERIVINLKQEESGLNGAKKIHGFLLAGDRLKPLPIGSTLDSDPGIFYWQPGPGFIGPYELVFFRERNGEIGNPLRLKITIEPRCK